MTRTKIPNRSKKIRRSVNSKYESSDEEWNEEEEYISSSSEDSFSEEEALSVPKRKRHKKAVISSSSSSDGSDEESESDLQIIAEFPAGTTPLVRTNYKLDDSGSDTYSSDDDCDDNKSNGKKDAIISATDKADDSPQSLVTIDSDIICDTTINSPDSGSDLSPISMILSDSSNSSIEKSSEPKPTEPLPKPAESKSKRPEPQSKLEEQPVVLPPEPPEPPRFHEPEPQLPPPCPTKILIKTPNLIPYEITVFKAGKAIKVPPPPKLPPTLVFHIMDSNQTIKEIKKRLNNDSDEIEAIEQTLKISLICPITNKKVKIPSRSLKCHHFDCFDINSFLEINYNKKIEDWKCPKCKQPAKANQLIIDSLLWHILSHNSVKPEAVESVIFDNKAIWVPDIKLQENHINQNNESNVINISDANADDIIIDLDDDDDIQEPNNNIQQSVNTSKQISIKLSETPSKTVEKNNSNVNQNNQRGGNSDEPNYDRILSFLKSAENEINLLPPLSRWSNTPNPPPPSNHVSIPSAATFRQPFNSFQQNSGRPISDRTNTQQIGTQRQAIEPPPKAHPVRTSAVVSVNKSECTLKFVFGSDGKINSVSCPTCNESFHPNLSDEHLRSPKHLNKTSNITTTTRTQPQRNPIQQQPIRHNNSNNNNNNNWRFVQQNNNNNNRAPLRTNSSFNYASNLYNNNNNWNQYNMANPMQSIYGNTNYQYSFPPVQPSITNNFYSPPNNMFIQQLAQPPQAHQALPPPQPTSQNVYPNQMSHYPPVPQNQSNGYYNY